MTSLLCVSAKSQPIEKDSSTIKRFYYSEIEVRTINSVFDSRDICYSEYLKQRDELDKAQANVDFLEGEVSRAIEISSNKSIIIEDKEYQIKNLAFAVKQRDEYIAKTGKKVNRWKIFGFSSGGVVLILTVVEIIRAVK
jgi:hypothetical protein